jgi:hypothetical protein
MSDETIFYIVGPVLAASAIVVSLIGLRVQQFPGRAVALVFLWFAILVGGTTTYAVLHSQDEEAHREQKSGLPQATKESEKAENK